MSNSRAVLIGNGHFNTEIPESERLSEQDSPIRDVDGLKGVLSLREHGKYLVTPITDLRHHQISATMNEVLSAAGEEDTVLVYFSGHALMSGESLYLAAYETQRGSAEAFSLPFIVVQNMVATKSVRGRFNVIGILDCCFSGMAIDSLPEHIVGKGGFSYILAASTHERPAFGVAGDYSLLTRHIIEGIKTGAADQDLDGWVCMDELYTYARSELSKTGHQTPQGRPLTTNWRDLRLAKTDSKERRKKLDQVFEKLTALRRASDIQHPLFLECQQLIDPAHRVNTEFEKHKLTLLYELSDNNLSVDDFKEQWEEIKEEEKTTLTTEKVSAGGNKRSAPPITGAQLNPAFEQKGLSQDKEDEDER
jgi:hypothetical protein